MKRNTSLPWLAVVAMSVAILAGAPASASTVNDYPEDALKFAFVGAYRYGGDQPVDLRAEVVDTEGMPVEGAIVTVEISTLRSAQVRRIELSDKDSGEYLACDAAYLAGSTDEDVYTFTATMNRMHPAVAKVKSGRGNLCGDGQPQIEIASIQAAKFDGANQPLSVIVDLVDDGGNKVSGANVLATASGTQDGALTHLSETASARYIACNVARPNTSGVGQIEVTVYASAQGYRPATASTLSTVGYLCPTLAQPPTTARSTR